MSKTNALYVVLVCAAATMAIVTFIAFLFLSVRNYAVAPTEDTPAPIDQQVDPVAKKHESIHVLFGGDVMLGRYVETLMNARGVMYPFERIQEVLRAADYTFLNLEGPIATDHVQTPDFTTNFSFLPHVTGVLRQVGVDGVSLANNHTLDKGAEVYEQTKHHLSEASIDFSGHAVRMGEEAYYEKVINGKRFIFASFNITFPSSDQEAAIETVRNLRESKEGYLVVNVHWGDEYALSANASQRELAKAFIDAGADLIIGHHPHVVQDIGYYNGAYIFYSLGNLVFDQYFSVDVEQGLLVEAVFNDEVEFRLHPIQSKLSQPYLMEGAARKTFLEGLATRSDAPLRAMIREGVLR